MTMNINNLITILSTIKDNYMAENTTEDAAEDAVKYTASSMEDKVYADLRGSNRHRTNGSRAHTPKKTEIHKVVKMYFEVINGEDAIPSATAREVSDDWMSGFGQFHSGVFNPGLFSWFAPSININNSVNNSDHSWGKTSNTTNNYNTPATPTEAKKSKNKETAKLEEYIVGAAAVILLGTVGLTAIFPAYWLGCEVYNHLSRFYWDEGRVLASMLLLGTALSYSLAMLTLYELTSTLLMTVMTTAAFANPAVWAFSMIALGAVIATPLFNMFIREGIYTLFSQFDRTALVNYDSRFRALNEFEIDKLKQAGKDPDRIHFATVSLFDGLEQHQTREPFAFYDIDKSDEMKAVLKDVRAIRNNDKDEVDIQRPMTESKARFSLFKSGSAASSASSASARTYNQNNQPAFSVHR